MTGAIRFPTFSLPPRATGRFRRALALSAAFHLLFVAAMAPEPPGGRARSEAVASLTVRLVPQPATATVGSTLPEPDIPAAERRTGRPAPVLDRKPRATAAEPAVRPTQDAPPLSLPQVPDPTYYAARDLDSYPRPVAPLDFQRLGDRAVASSTAALRLEVLIDEHGVVNDISFPGPRAPVHLEKELRAMLVSTRFYPARKDRQAVKSRVLMSINFETSDR